MERIFSSRVKTFVAGTSWVTKFALYASTVAMVAISFPLLSRADASMCQALFAPATTQESSSGWLNIPYLGNFVRARRLAREVGTNPTSRQTDFLTWKYWTMQTVSNESVVVLNDSRFDPVYTAWLNKAPPPSPQFETRLTDFRRYVRTTFQKDSESFRGLLNEWRLRRLLGSNATAGYDIGDSATSHAYIRLGEFIRIKRASCRHQAAALVALLQTNGIRAEYRGGELIFKGKHHGHAWVIAHAPEGQVYLIDPAGPLSKPVAISDANQAVKIVVGDVPITFEPREGRTNGAVEPVGPYHDHKALFFSKAE